jgi:hypothetical protein
MKVKKTVTPLKLQANQENAKQSTGPKTPKGKSYVRRNAMKHGLTARRLMFGDDGQPIDNGVAELVEALRARYGTDDIVSELLIDNIAVDHWRQKQGLEAEIKYVDRKEWSFYPQGSLPTIQRYNTANRRAILTNLELLEKRHAAEEAETEFEPADSEDAASADENGTELANQEPTETPVDNAGELPQSFSAKPSPQATLPNPEESDGNSLDIPVVESELSDETQQSENPAPGETAA